MRVTGGAADSFLTSLEEERLKSFAHWCRLGFDEMDSLRLAEAEADVADAVRLINLKCPLRLVVEILA